MEQQKIFRKQVSDNLVLKVKSGEGIELFRNSEFQFNDEDSLIMPHVNRPLNLIDNLDHDDVYNSALKIYESYKTLTPLEAADPRFWNFLSVVELYPHLIKKWPNVYERKEGINERDYILEHFLVSNSSDLMRHWLSGLWWTVYLSYDEENEDPYHLTKIMCWNETLRTRTMGTGLFARNKSVALGVLDYLKERGLDSFGSFDSEHREIVKYLNLVGGTKPLPIYTRGEVKKMLLDRFPIPINEETTS